MIARLPHWCIVEKFPAFNDFESLTAIEQTARVYGKINELIESYNKYVEEINKVIDDYELDKYEDVKKFICRISCLTDNYINTVDMKIAHQDRQIAEVYEKFSADVLNTIKILVSDLYTAGELDNAIYEAINNLDKKVDELINNCNKAMVDLEADYNETKANLEADYNGFKNDFTEKQNKVLFSGTYISQDIENLVDYSLVCVTLKNPNGTEPVIKCLGYVEKDGYTFSITGAGSPNSIEVIDTAHIHNIIGKFTLSGMLLEDGTGRADNTTAQIVTTIRELATDTVTFDYETANIIKIIGII